MRKNKELYGDAKLLPLNRKAVEQRIQILTERLAGFLPPHATDQDNHTQNKLEKDIKHWQFMLDNHTAKTHLESFVCEKCGSAHEPSFEWLGHLEVMEVMGGETKVVSTGDVNALKLTCKRCGYQWLEESL